MAEKLTERFAEGDRVVHITESDVPEGATGTVLGRAGYPHGDRWEVEYDNYPCGRGPYYPWEKSATSWISRDTSIELTRDAALAKFHAARQPQGSRDK